MPVLLYVYQPGADIRVIQDANVDALRAALSDSNTVTWIVTEGQDATTDAIMREVLALHRLERFGC